VVDEFSLMFHLPSREGWAELVKDLGLDHGQAHELDLALRHIDEDLRTIAEDQRRLGSRDDRMARLNRIARALFTLEEELGPGGARIGDVLPFNSLEAIGRGLSYTAMEETLGRPLTEPGLGEALKEEAFARIAQIEERFDCQRHAVGLNHGSALLAHLLASINGPVRTWFDFHRLDKGGRATDPEHEYVILVLSRASRAVVGRGPTAIAGGAFQALCAGVFAQCGLESDSLEKAVKKVLSRRRRQRAQPGKVLTHRATVT
jgi:hypothetical protein